jgi:hypothetical protein
MHLKHMLTFVSEANAQVRLETSRKGLEGSRKLPLSPIGCFHNQSCG